MSEIMTLFIPMFSLVLGWFLGGRNRSNIEQIKALQGLVETWRDQYKEQTLKIIELEGKLDDQKKEIYHLRKEVADAVIRASREVEVIKREYELKCEKCPYKTAITHARIS
jgi:Tfp pilus assembly protein PilO